MADYLPELQLSHEENTVLTRHGFTPGAFLSEGCWGNIYMGKYFNTDIVIKEINVPCAGVPAVLMEMFILKMIRHRNVVRVIDFFFLKSKSKDLLIFMEFLKGGTLRELIEKTTFLSEADVAKLYGQFGSGLAFMHNRGFAHRDLKPENILLTEDQKVAKLADFGLSIEGYDIYTGKPIKIDDWDGSGCYLAPEELYKRMYLEHFHLFWFRPTPFCPFLADIWSMGIIVCEMLHGSEVYPFTVPLPWNTRVMYKKITNVPKLLDKYFYPDLTNAAKNFVKRHLMVKQKHRPDMDELLEDKWIQINQVLGETIII